MLRSILFKRKARILYWNYSSAILVRWMVTEDVTPYGKVQQITRATVQRIIRYTGSATRNYITHVINEHLFKECFININKLYFKTCLNCSGNTTKLRHWFKCYLSNYKTRFARLLSEITSTVRVLISIISLHTVASSI